ncbi:RNA polymerase II elongation factor ELL-like isoform X1 [Takifugu rubripes]|uniref:RNA polymerase II elongation factor ELL-like isoform X1 n=1 Tax=Takifugu rubripes TaxID=31033 RepID=UPI00114529C9|nr:RNA polymerase II elongation factor ELL-like isoform X1 [Takifugu rubripes]XP_029702457.1 RNA polymerase II elongation factor ELL-like isoform X1 [Takifugu rubripes]
MTSLRQELHYRLYCGNNHRGRSGNRTLFHVKLTDSAIRTLEAHQNLKESSLGKASICFKGNQGSSSSEYARYWVGLVTVERSVSGAERTGGRSAAQTSKEK